MNREAMLVAALVPEEETSRDETHFVVTDAINGYDREDGRIAERSLDRTGERARLIDAANAYLAHGPWHPMLAAIRGEAVEGDVERWHVPTTSLEIRLRPDGYLIFHSGTDSYVSPHTPKHHPGCPHPPLAVDRIAYDPVTQIVFYVLRTETDPNGCYWVGLHGAIHLPFRKRAPYPAHLDLD